MMNTNTNANMNAERDSTAVAVVVPESVNWHMSRECNYGCVFCLHTYNANNRYFVLPIDEARRGLKKLADAGCKKINFAGGEPFLQAEMLGELCRYCREELNVAVTIISNGSLVTAEWLDKYGRFVNVFGMSIDSFRDDVNTEIGRRVMNNSAVEGTHASRVRNVAAMCRARGIRVKINTVVNSLNAGEDMAKEIAEIAPCRWKVFKMLLLESERAGGRARALTATDEQFREFVRRHSALSPIAEDNATMKDSYLLMDERMRFLDCSSGVKVPGRSILDFSVEEALSDVFFDSKAFHDRKGVWDW